MSPPANHRLRRAVVGKEPCAGGKYQAFGASDAREARSGDCACLENVLPEADDLKTSQTLDLEGQTGNMKMWRPRERCHNSRLDKMDQDEGIGEKPGTSKDGPHVGDAEELEKHGDNDKDWENK
ncbi:hypothetical protein MKZ38_005518 [Zalerion maritima]|uniref:Uncharacterized protein n=1 Tax=Zalerion maritima TaxID=339359 RepID=A0AAD5WWL4_9PEZI|nr:hypothetical protein MKZ38_005518 [Zalerion maritima]